MTIINYSARRQYKTEIIMGVAREHMKTGKRVLFSYNDLRFGISILHIYFPNALFEVVGTCGLVVWERKTK